MDIKGKNEKSLPVPQFFSWVNNCNEGSNEKMTLDNLDFFAWLESEYGMKIEIYAMDAGNFDSPNEQYFDKNNPSWQKNFPEGFKNIVARAKQLGITFGVWGGPDGFGNTPQEEQKRFDEVVSLCKNYGFGLFKFDLVCGSLREEKKEVFEKMLCECRKYCPELIVLNHRIDMGSAQKYVTTFLWEGLETYVDVMACNGVTAPHHRARFLMRGLVPELQRLCEDHGVCISSCNDFFEDDLILQAFSRSLVLSPEIYGNPWFLRDDEYARLARIYNLSKKYGALLVEGVALGEKYGDFAVSRGDGKSRIITLRNNTWEPITIQLSLGSEIGITDEKPVHFLQYHPTQKYFGKFEYNAVISVVIEPFRTYMALASTKTPDDILLSGCDYEVVKSLENEPAEVNIIRADGKVEILSDFTAAELDGKAVKKEFECRVDEYLHAPKKLGVLSEASVPQNAEELYETTCYAASGDSLEAQSVLRAGKTRFAAVQKCRDDFFSQTSYKIRGCEFKNMFDENPDTFYDTWTLPYGQRVSGGALRIDLGKTLDADELSIDFFNADCSDIIKPNIVPDGGDLSADLVSWTPFSLSGRKTLGKKTAPVALQSVDNLTTVDGTIERASYRLNGKARYIRLPEPPERIYEISFFKNGKKLCVMPKNTNNMLAPYAVKKARAARALTVCLPAFKKGSYISIALNGQHGVEGVYCAGMCKNTPVPCPDRAPSFPVNNWNHFVCKTGANNTYYMPLSEDMQSKTMTLYALVLADGDEKFEATAWLCSPNDEKKGKALILK